MAKVGVIGAGSWGIALAKLLRTNGNEVTVWSIVEEEVAMLCREHEHIDKLPGVKLPEDVLFTTDLKEAIVGKEFLILAVPSVFTRSTAKSMAGYVTEVAVKPPTFVVFVNDKNLMHFSYTRYLENRIRETFGFRGTALKFITRERKED